MAEKSAVPEKKPEQYHYLARASSFDDNNGTNECRTTNVSGEVTNITDKGILEALRGRAVDRAYAAGRTIEYEVRISERIT